RIRCAAGRRRGSAGGALRVGVERGLLVGIQPAIFVGIVLGERRGIHGGGGSPLAVDGKRQEQDHEHWRGQSGEDRGGEGLGGLHEKGGARWICDRRSVTARPLALRGVRVRVCET